VAEVLREIQREARWLLLSRLAAGQGFQFVPPEQADALAEELQLKPGVLPNPEQLTEFRLRLEPISSSLEVSWIMGKFAGSGRPQGCSPISRGRP